MARKMVNKRPSLQFYPSDWLRDVELQSATAVAKGVWINVLCRMWDNRERGEITGHIATLAKLCIVEKDEFLQFIKEAETLQFCYINRYSNGCVTIRNRRMYGEVTNRENTRLRVAKHREKQQSNTDVTPPSSSSSSSSSSKVTKKASIRYDQTAFDQFWSAYPKSRRVGKKKCVDWWKSHKPESVILGGMLLTLRAWRLSDEWSDPKFIPHPLTWLNREGWEDIPPPPKFEPKVKREEMPDHIIAGSAAEKKWLSKNITSQPEKDSPALGR